MKIEWILAAGLFAGTLCADSLRLSGVLGNSGEWSRPVLFGDTKNLRNIGIGVVYDDSRGILYDRAGRDRLNAYTLDGRLYAVFPLPVGASHLDMAVRCGDRMVMLIGGGLYTLRFGSASGTRPAPVPGIGHDVVHLAASAPGGRVVILRKSGKLERLDPATGKTEPFADLGRETWCNGMDFDSDGGFYFARDRFIDKIADGKPVDEPGRWPRRYIGIREGGAERMRFLDGAWWGGSWHGTVKRFDREFAPAPGVVLGGGSGHFIGYVPCNYDAENTRGMALLRPGLFALDGHNGVVQLAEYNSRDKRLQLLRRIGAFPEGAVAIDGAGSVLGRQLIWNASADSQSPAAFSVVFEGFGPLAKSDPDTVWYPCRVYGQVGLAWGKLREQQLRCGNAAAWKLPADPVGMAVYRERADGNGGWRLLVLGADGKTTLAEVWPDRNPFKKMLSGGELVPAVPVRRWSSLTAIDNRRLLAAGDGKLIEFTRDGDRWKESRRFGEKFGPDLKIACASGRIAVSDRENGRVSILDLDGRVLAAVRIGTPGALDFNGSTVVLHDSVNQRILKLEYQPSK